MKKILIALVIVGFTCSANGQTLQSIVNTLTQFSSVYPPISDVKKVAIAPHKKKIRYRKPEIRQNFKVCTDNTGYYICDERPDAGNATHRCLTTKISTMYFSYDNLYDLQDNPNTVSKINVAPQEQSYPRKANAINPSSYVIMYPKIHFIEVGKQHKAVSEVHYAYGEVPKAQYDGQKKNNERNENANNPNAKLSSSGGRSE